MLEGVSVEDGGRGSGVGLLLSDVMKKNLKDWCNVYSNIL